MISLQKSIRRISELRFSLRPPHISSVSPQPAAMNDLFSGSFSRFRSEDQSHPHHNDRMSSSAGAGVNLDKFFEDVESVEDDLKELERLHQRLQSAHEKSKTLHDAKAVTDLRSSMDSDVTTALSNAKLVKVHRRQPEPPPGEKTSSMLISYTSNTFPTKYLEKDVLVKGLSSDTSIYVVKEGHEPPFFTCFFSWDPSKANLHGNSFERKLAILKGGTQKTSETPIRNSWSKRSSGATPNSSRSSSVSSNGQGRSASPLYNLRSSYNRQFSSPTPLVKKLFSEFSPTNGIRGSPEAQLRTSSEDNNPIQIDGSVMAENLLIYPFERLKVTSYDPATDIDVTRREVR